MPGGIRSNQELMQQTLINKAAMNTTNLANGGLLLPEQAATFFRMVFDATPFAKMHRKLQRRATRGEIDKIAIGGRLLRKKTEDTDDGYRGNVAHAKVEYYTQPVRLPWEITEESLRQNIEGENYEDLVMGMMTQQIGIDMEDLHWNGDTSLTGDPFLNINNGWLKKIKAGAHVVDHATLFEADGTTPLKFGKATFFRGLASLPNKYKQMGLKWIMSPHRKEMWMEYLTNRQYASGDAALLGAGTHVNQPLGYDIVTSPSFPDDLIVLCDPMNLISVWTYEIRVRKTTEGKEAVMQDKRFYTVHFDDDAIIQDLDGIMIIKGIPASVAAGV